MCLGNRNKSEVSEGIGVKVRQAHGSECNIVFLVEFSFFRSFSVFFNIIRSVLRTLLVSKMERSAKVINGFHKTLYLRCLAGF